MSTDWINVAMDNGATITLSRLQDGVLACAMWTTDTMVERSGKGVAEALENLNTALREDAANEMREAGVV